MKSLWNEADAAKVGEEVLSRRVYTSRLLGQEPSLVLHGGGNTSAKAVERNILGDDEAILWVKGSGWDLATITAKGYAPARLAVLQRLATLSALSDTDMMRELRAACTDPSAPTPSVEAILHAIIPLRYVDHTHADAVVAISNTAEGESILQTLYGKDVLILPYVMPGFILAQQVYEATRNLDWTSLKGIILLHHGVFTFHDDAQVSYENMIELVNRAEVYLHQRGVRDTLASCAAPITTEADLLALATARQSVGRVAGRAMLATWDMSREAVGYASMSNIESIATRGPVTPDHTLHTKHIPMVCIEPGDESVSQFGEIYREYFARNASAAHVCLDPAPRVGVWQGRGVLSFAPTAKRLRIVRDIARHTQRAIQWGESLGGWCALPERDLFELEYWELEQAKLKSPVAVSAMEGQIALVTGAASGIGKACVEALIRQGAVVVALDINPVITSLFASTSALGLVCDVKDKAQIQACVAQAVITYGGIDMVVSNAGCFTPSAPVGVVDSQLLADSLSLNFTSHVDLLQACLPYLVRGMLPAVVIVASKNVPAPGPGAVAYSAAKAALTQMARVAALEWGEFGVRINVVHPNAVFDTGVWDDATLQKRADAYGLSVEAYKTSNVLGCEVTSADVANVVVSLCGRAFACTTGAQIPVDGGNERVI